MVKGEGAAAWRRGGNVSILFLLGLGVLEKPGGVGASRMGVPKDRETNETVKRGRQRRWRSVVTVGARWGNLGPLRIWRRLRSRKMR